MKIKSAVLLGIAAIVVTVSSTASSASSEKTASKNTAPSYSQSTPAQLVSYASEEARLSSMEIVAEQGKSLLYFDKTTAQIAVKNKNDGSVWFSSPYNTASLAIDDKIKAQLWSPVRISYLDSSLTKFEYNSFTDCSALGQLSSEPMGNGVKVTMTLGEMEQNAFVPAVVSISNFKNVLSKLPASESKFVEGSYKLITISGKSASETKKLLAQYPGLSKQSLYVIKTLTKAIEKRLSEDFAAASYTYADYEADRQVAYGTDSKAMTQKPNFTLTLEYYLENGDLVVNLPTKQIKYDESICTLLDVSVMEYFGATGAGDIGYFMVPDGSGALLNYDNYLNGTGVGLSAPVYGSNSVLRYDSSLHTKKVFRMPVFGANTGGSGWLSVIEEGASQCDIFGIINESETTVNKLGAVCHLRISDDYTYYDKTFTSTYKRSDPNGYSGNYKLRFRLMDQGKATYSDMAAVYRDYLEGNGTLKKRDNTDASLYLGVIGSGSDKNGAYALTPYSQASAMVKELKESGVSSLNLRYSGWANGGLDYTVFNRAKVLKVLGGKKAFNQLEADAESYGVGLFPDVDVSYIRRNTLTDGFTLLTDAAKQLDSTYARTFSYNIGSNSANYNDISIAVKPSKMYSFFQSFLKSFKNASNGLSLVNIGDDLHSDCAKNGMSRADSEKISADILKSAVAQYQVMVDGGNAYSWGYASHILNMDSTSSSFDQEECSIPFMQMVLHGYISYTGTAVNLSSDPKRALLKAIENGESLYFVVAEDNITRLSGSKYSQYYSVDYSYWKDIMTENYKTISSVLKNTYGATMDGHKLISPEIVRITYSNGVQVIVNYSDRQYEDNGQTIMPMSAGLIKAA